MTQWNLCSIRPFVVCCCFLVPGCLLPRWVAGCSPQLAAARRPPLARAPWRRGRCPPAAASRCPAARWRAGRRHAARPPGAGRSASRALPHSHSAVAGLALPAAATPGAAAACLPLCRSAAAPLYLRRRRALPPWTPAAALAAPQRLAAGLPPCLPALAAATADLGRAGGSSVPVGVREEDRRGLGHWGVGSCFGLSRLGLLGWSFGQWASLRRGGRRLGNEFWAKIP